MGNFRKTYLLNTQFLKIHILKKCFLKTYFLKKYFLESNFLKTFSLKHVTLKWLLKKQIKKMYSLIFVFILKIHAALIHELETSFPLNLCLKHKHPYNLKTYFLKHIFVKLISIHT